MRRILTACRNLLVYKSPYRLGADLQNARFIDEEASRKDVQQTRQQAKLFAMKLQVSFLLVSTLLASAAKVHGGGVTETNQTAVTHSIDLVNETLTVGQTITVAYLSPDKGRVTINLFSAEDDHVLHVDARFDWYGWYKILVLNSAVGSAWPYDQEEHPSGFPFPSEPNTLIVLHITVKEGFFEIAAKGFLYEYQYRGDLLPATVEKIQYYFEDTGAEKKAKLVYMDLSSSGLKNNFSIVGILYVYIDVVVNCIILPYLFVCVSCCTLRDYDVVAIGMRNKLFVIKVVAIIKYFHPA